MSRKKDNISRKKDKLYELQAFSERLQLKSEERGESTVTLAIKLKAKRQTVDNWFRGRNFPKSYLMKNLADILGVPVGWLRRGETGLLLKTEMTTRIPPETSKSGPQSTILHKSIAEHTHEDLIQFFKDKEMARYLNKLLLDIENIDPETLKRDVRRFLEGVLVGLESKKNENLI